MGIKHYFRMLTIKNGACLCVCVVISDTGYLGRGQAGVCSERGERKSWLETVDRGRPAPPGERTCDTLAKLFQSDVPVWSLLLANSPSQVGYIEQQRKHQKYLE